MAQIISNKKLKTDANEDEDLISKLPDEILAHILSGFSAREAVSTGVLSKRWKLVWTLVPNLEFEFNVYDLYHVNETSASFVFSLKDVVRPQRSAKVRCNGRYELHDKDWFEALVMNSLEYFDLRIRSHYSSLVNVNLLPGSFSVQKNLVELKLGYVVVNVPPLVRFPCLRYMKLAEVQFLGDESMNNLFSGCPSLTDLRIYQKKCAETGKRLDIRTSSLQRLYLHVYNGTDTRVVIDAPRLRSLVLYGARAAYEMIDVSSLEKVHVSSDQCGDTSFELFRQISRVQELFVAVYILKSFLASRFLEERNMFGNLTRLTLRASCDEIYLDLLPRMLYYAPNVVHIIVELINQHCTWENPLDSVDSILASIESVEVTEESDQRWPVVSCSLGNATTALKKLSFRGLPLHFARENRFLNGLLTACEVKCKCATLLRMVRCGEMCVRDRAKLKPGSYTIFV